MALQIRRGTNAERLGITLVEGEVVYVTDFELSTVDTSISNTSNLTLISTLNHGLVVGQQIKYIGATGNGLTAGQVYFVKTVPSATSFTLSATLNGTYIVFSGTATGLIFALGPTDALGVPYGYSISPLYVGDGITAGGNPAGSSVLDDLYDVEIGVYGNVGQYGEALASNNVLQYNSTTDRWENRANLTVNGNITATGVYSQAGDTLKINSDSTAANSTLYFKGTDVSLNYNNSTSYFEFTNNLARGTLFLSSDGTSGTVSTGIGTLNLNTPSGSGVAVQRDLTVGGNLTVNGTTTTVNSTTLTVDDKNIELASTASPSDASADGGGITLKGTTDKKIFWSNSDDRWYYDSGDGANNIFVRDLTDLSNVATTSFTKGDLFLYDGTNWINDNKIQVDTSAQRITFQYNNSDVGATPSGLFARRNFTTPGSFAAGDGTGIGFQLSNDNGAATTFATIGARYDPSVSSVILRTSTDNFDTNNLTVASFDAVEAELYGTKLLFRSAFTGVPAAGDDITIEVERGSETNATITWDESNVFWSLSNDVYAGARFIAGTDLALNGKNIYFNNADVTPSGNYSLVVKRGSSADVALRWNETSDRWEFTTNGSTYYELPNQGLDQDDTPTFAGTVSGNVRVGVASDNEIDTSTGNLTIDSAGGTTTIDDQLIVSSTAQVNGTASLLSSVQLGSISTHPIDVYGALRIQSNFIQSSTGTAIQFNGVNTVLTGDLTVGGSGYIYSPSDLALDLDGANVRVVGDLTIGGNDIKSSTGATAITLSTDDVTVTDRLFVAGNIIGSNGGYTALTFDQSNVTVGGDLTVTGNDIKASNGNTNITMTSNTLTTFAGDIQVNGNDIKDSSGRTELHFGNDGTNYYTTFGTGYDGVVCGYMFMDQRALFNTGTLTTTATTANQVLDSFAAATYRSCKYYVQITSGSEYQAFEGIVVHNGTSAFITAFNDVRTNGNLATISADVSGGNVRLLVTPVNAATVFKITKTLIVV